MALHTFADVEDSVCLSSCCTICGGVACLSELTQCDLGFVDHQIPVDIKKISEENQGIKKRIAAWYQKISNI
jgi:hypothetical protein